MARPAASGSLVADGLLEAVYVDRGYLDRLEDRLELLAVHSNCLGSPVHGLLDQVHFGGDLVVGHSHVLLAMLPVHPDHLGGHTNGLLEPAVLLLYGFRPMDIAMSRA